MMQALKDYIPEIEEGVRLVQAAQTVSIEDRVFNEAIVMADGSFSEVFNLPMVKGQTMAKPLDIVVSERMAMKYFGHLDVIGESLTVCCIGDPMTMRITGVMQDLPQNTHLEIDFLAYLEPSWFESMPNILDTWTSVNTFTYFRLARQLDIEHVQQRISYWLDHESPFMQMVEEGTVPTDLVSLKLMSLTDLHLLASRDAGNMGDMRPLGDINLVYAFIAVALLILLIASINFMNLSTAKASQRSREVALRKVMGASRGQISLQFLGEAIAISLVALLFALVAVEAVLPSYSDAIGRELSFSLVDNAPLLLSLVLLTMLVGAVSGSYPAMYLSRFLPSRILQSNQSAQGGARMRSFLVVLQFSISIGLAICTVVVFSQVMYARSFDTGYSVSSKLVLDGFNRIEGYKQKQSMADALSRLPGVRSVVLSSDVPSQDNENNTGFRPMDRSAAPSAGQDGLVLNYYSVGAGFFEAYEMTMVAGRTFDDQFGTDAIQVTENENAADLLAEASSAPGSAGIIINESALHQFGFSSAEAAIGQVLQAEVFRSGPGGQGNRTHNLSIVGVARDVYFRSIRFGIRPSVFFYHPLLLNSATITFDTDDELSLIKDIEAVWQERMPQVPVRHRFLTDMVRAQYQTEERQGLVLAVFSALALIVACLGLFGLASFMAERRTREIGIRKVMGAGISDIVGLLVWQFSKPVLFANVVAWPVAGILMSGWLEGYSYRIHPGVILLISTAVGLTAIIIAWSTVAGRAYGVARANPVSALRHE
jgi:putative ABC transport system permease protein